MLRPKKIHDMDDNLRIIPTQIHLVDLHWNPMSVSTWVFWQIREQEWILFKCLPDQESFIEFSEHHDKKFVSDLSISEPWPVMWELSEDINYWNYFWINTSRGHHPNTIRWELEIWILNSMFWISLDKMIDWFLKHVALEGRKTTFPRFEKRQIIKQNEQYIVKQYLSKCPIFTVNHPLVKQWLNKRYNTNYNDTANLKALATKAFVEIMYPEFWRLTNSTNTLTEFQFTDDDIWFINIVNRLFVQMALWWKWFFWTAYTGQKGIIKRKTFLPIKS